MTENLGFIPAQIIAGETIWIAAANTIGDAEDITLEDFPLTTGHTLVYQFAAATPITVNAVENAGLTGWTLEVTAAQTLVWKPGRISFAGYVTVTSTGRKYAVDAGAVTVTASPLATSNWTAIKAACEAALLTGATSGVLSWGVDGVNTAYKSTAELISLREYARTMELRDTGNKPARMLRTRFT